MSLNGRSSTSATRRLYIFLRDIQGAPLPGNTPNRVFDVLPRVLGVSENNANRAAMRAIAQLQGMFDAAEREIDRCFEKEETRALHKRPLASLIVVFSPLTLNAGWEQYRSNLRPEYLTGLEYSAHAVDELRGELQLEDSEIKSVREVVEDAISELRSANLTPEAKLLLEQALDNVRNALQGYRFGGLEGLKQAIASYTGAVALTADEIKTRVDEGTKSKLWDVVARVSDLISLAQVGWIGYHALTLSGSLNPHHLLQ